MPKIPRFQPSEGFPVGPVSPGAVTAPYEALIQAGERAETAGAYAASTFAAIAERDRMAEVQKQALKIGNSVRDDEDVFAEGLYGRTDYENFEKDVDEWEKRVRERHQPMLKTMDGRESPELSLAVDRVISDRTTGLKKLARDKARQQFVNEAKGEWVKSQDYYVRDFVNEDDPDRKVIIKNNMEIEARELASRGILWPQDAEVDIKQFDAKVIRALEMADEARAREAIIIDPETALDLIGDKTKFTNLNPIKRTELFEHAEVRIRVEGSRLDKLTRAVQNENRAKVLDEWAVGKLDLDRLRQYREADPETGQRGLSDEFFTSMMEKLRQGRDTVTDPDTFNRLYLKDDLRWKDVDKESNKISEKDTRVLLNRILQERREDVRDSKEFRKKEEAEKKAGETEEKKIARERRNAYAGVAKKFMTKAMNELSMKAEDGLEVLKTFQGYVDDKSIAPEDLPKMAEKLMEAKKGGVIKWIKGLLSSTGKEQEWSEAAPETVTPEKPAAIPPVRPQRKSLDEIFGGKRP
jgi:hypothetical protein